VKKVSLKLNSSDREQLSNLLNNGSWLNLAEVEISAMSRQCLNRRIPTDTELQVELLAWQTRRNQHHKMIRWKFTKKAADLKLGKYYAA
jgi:hypothetical protein